MFLLGLLKFSVVRALLLALVRSPQGRKALRAGFRAVGGMRLLRFTWRTIRS
jgi:hypothetical protein